MVCTLLYTIKIEGMGAMPMFTTLNVGFFADFITIIGFCYSMTTPITAPLVGVFLFLNLYIILYF